VKTMHYKLLFITPAKNKAEAVNNASEYMDGICESEDWADYYTIGGRWAHILQGNASKITEDIYDRHLLKWSGVVYRGGISWYSEDAPREKVKKEDEGYLTPRTYRGEIPFADYYVINNTYDGGIRRDYIGKYYIVIVDYHN
jgi:hypothetical protein